MTPKQLEAIRKHGEQLNAIFHTGLDPLTLCKKLRRIEGAATKITTDYCNGVIDGDQLEQLLDRIMGRLSKVLGLYLPADKDFTQLAAAVIINRDPRGYALKIDDDYMRAHRLQLHTDLGGYGILSPEIGKNGR